jgi:hypothetical protein
MKKISRKLVLRSETIRMLANMDLARAVGGFNSNATQCTAFFDSDPKACQTDAVDTGDKACTTAGL